MLRRQAKEAITFSQDRACFCAHLDGVGLGLRFGGLQRCNGRELFPVLGGGFSLGMVQDVGQGIGWASSQSSSRSSPLGDWQRAREV